LDCWWSSHRYKCRTAQVMPKKKPTAFNPIQIKDGFIVRMSKDGRIKEKLDTYPPSNNKKSK
jgi:hypothetical protein